MAHAKPQSREILQLRFHDVAGHEHKTLSKCTTSGSRKAGPNRFTKAKLPGASRMASPISRIRKVRCKVQAEGRGLGKPAVRRPQPPLFHCAPRAPRLRTPCSIGSSRAPAASPGGGCVSSSTLTSGTWTGDASRGRGCCRKRPPNARVPIHLEPPKPA